MTCRQAEELIGTALDGALKPAERDRLDSHLADCAACRAAWEEHHQLARLANRWTPKAGQAEDTDDLFTAQVLSRIAARPVPAPAQQSLGRPLAVVVCLSAALVFLPHSLWPGLSVVSASVHNLPVWLLVNGRAMPDEIAAAWNANVIIPTWLWSALLAAGVINGVFYARVTQSRRRSLS